jgi:GAF domain-containing protein
MYCHPTEFIFSRSGSKTIVLVITLPASLPTRARVWAAADIYALGLQGLSYCDPGSVSGACQSSGAIAQGQCSVGVIVYSSLALQPHDWQDTEIEFVQQIAMHLSVALQHAEAMNSA